MEVISIPSEEHCESSEPPKKKLRQSRLPFQVVSPKVQYNEKKRKLSNTSLTEEKVTKAVRTETKENLDVESIAVIDLTSNKCNNESKVIIIEGKENEDVVCTNNENINETEDEKTEDETSKKRSSLSMLSNIQNSENNDDGQLIPISDSDNENEKSLLDNSILISDSDNDSDISESENDSQSDAAVCSTPKNKSKEENSSGNEINSSTIKNDMIAAKKLTPKQVKKRLESVKKREERERAKQEREKQREEKRKQKEEERELKRKEREELKRKEKEEKEKKIEQKNEEKRLKEEAKRLKEEERKRKEEQKEEERLKREQEKEEAEQRKKKTALAFVNFFVPKKSETKKENEVQNVESKSSFMPFAVKPDMRVAPITRVVMESNRRQLFEETLNSLESLDTDKSCLYLNQLKNGKAIGKTTKTWPLNDVKEDDDVVFIDDSNICENVVEVAPTTEHIRGKLLQFCENRRPPYWGTWTKKSKNVKPRRPFSVDKAIFDYEIDSDDEWEEEEPGESLHGSDDEKESEDEYEVDNDFFVPHGYLSDEEAEDNTELLSPETQKARLKAMEIEFEAEMKSKTERLKPRLIGCVWATKNNEKPENVNDFVWRHFSNYKIIMSEPVFFVENSLQSDMNSSCVNLQNSGVKKIGLPVQYIPDYIRLIHGNINGQIFLIKEFKAFLQIKDENLNVSKRSLEKNLKELAIWMACPEEGSMLGKFCWYVKKDVRELHNVDVTLPNAWKYTLTPKRLSKVSLDLSTSEQTESPVVSVQKKSKINIKKFTKVLTEEEKQKKFMGMKNNVVKEEKPVTPIKELFKKRVELITLSDNSPSLDSLNKIKTPVEKKRVALISLPRITINSSNEVVEVPKEKKRVPLISVPKSDTVSKPQRTNLLTELIQKTEEKQKEILVDSEVVINLEESQKVLVETENIVGPD